MFLLNVVLRICSVFVHVVVVFSAFRAALDQRETPVTLDYLDRK